MKDLRKNRNGFTLAELLIVVAIIGILVSISIAIFNNQLEKAREAVDLANLRAAKSTAVYGYILEDLPNQDAEGFEEIAYDVGVGYYDPVSGTIVSSEEEAELVPFGKGTGSDPGNHGEDDLRNDIGIDYDYGDVTDKRILIRLEEGDIFNLGEDVDTFFHVGFTSALMDIDSYYDS